MIDVHFVQHQHADHFVQHQHADHFVQHQHADHVQHQHADHFVQHQHADHFVQHQHADHFDFYSVSSLKQLSVGITCNSTLTHYQNNHGDEVYSIQNYLIKFVSGLQFPPQIILIS